MQDLKMRDLTILLLLAMLALMLQKMFLQEQWGELGASILAIAYFLITWIENPKDDEEEENEE